MASDDAQQRSTMSYFSVESSGVASFFEGSDAYVHGVTYGISVVGPRHLLQTTEYYETGPEREQVGAFESSSWGVEVPDGAKVFSVTGASSPEQARQFWVGWQVKKRLYMQALMQQGPIGVDLAADETPLFPAVMDDAGVAALYSLRPAADHVALWRHVFTGAIKTKATVAVEALTELPGRPVVSIVGTVPSERRQHALIGWAEETPAGAVLGLAVVRPNQMRVVRSEPVPGFAPFLRQRPAIWASGLPSDERFQLTLVLESREAPKTFQEAKFTVGRAQEDHQVSLEPVVIPSGQLHAASFDYAKNHVEPFVQALYLTIDGKLWILGFPEPRRQGVSLDDPLAVMTTTRAYWGVRAADGKLKFESF